MQQTFKVEWAENKTNDWKVATLRDEHDKEYKDVSINRVGKKGDTFPNFDAIMTGASIEGVYWQSDAEKNYLFPPRPEGAGLKRTGGGFGSKASDARKAQMIEEAQARKSDSIAFFNATNAAIALFEQLKDPIVMKDTGAVKSFIKEWREWFLEQYREYEAKDVTSKHNAF